MKTIATLIATLVATAAFAATPVVSATPAAPAKCDPAKDKHCKVETKTQEITPVKSQTPTTKDAAKTTEPAKK